jgi:hypothetical protein
LSSVDDLAARRARRDLKAELAALWREIHREAHEAGITEPTGFVACTRAGCTEKLDVSDGESCDIPAGDDVGFLHGWRFDLYADTRLCPLHAAHPETATP